VFESCAARSNTGTPTSVCLQWKPRAIYRSHYSDQVVKENVRMVIGEELEIPGKIQCNIGVHLIEKTKCKRKIFLFT